jgi:hypothetical protein
MKIYRKRKVQSTVTAKWPMPFSQMGYTHLDQAGKTGASRLTWQCRYWRGAHHRSHQSGCRRRRAGRSYPQRPPHGWPRPVNGGKRRDSSVITDRVDRRREGRGSHLLGVERSAGDDVVEEMAADAAAAEEHHGEHRLHGRRHLRNLICSSERRGWELMQPRRRRRRGGRGRSGYGPIARADQVSLVCGPKMCVSASSGSMGRVSETQRLSLASESPATAADEPYAGEQTSICSRGGGGR